MQKSLVVPLIVFSLMAYFALTVFVLPEQYMSNEKMVSQPYFEVDLSDEGIFLGESFRLDIATENRGEYGDIHILSTAFPDLTEIGDAVKVVTYDFAQSYDVMVPGDDLIANYSGGLERTVAKYPSIEAMNRPVHPGSAYHMSQIITPEKPGIFSIYIKSVNIPHVSDLSHYPQAGLLDHQGEHVEVYSVNVNP